MDNWINGELPEPYKDIVVTSTQTHFDLKDRIKILIFGWVNVDIQQLLDVSPSEYESRTRVIIPTFPWVGPKWLIKFYRHFRKPIGYEEENDREEIERWTKPWFQ